MNLSQKCQYALRACLELGKRYGQGPVPISQVAKAQAIPQRFLELILAHLKQTGYVDSRRGADGGYFLTVPPSSVTVGDVIRFVDGPLDPVKCIGGSEGRTCPLRGRCAFLGLWERAKDAVTRIYDGTTFQDLIEEEAAEGHVTDFSI